MLLTNWILSHKAHQKWKWKPRNACWRRFFKKKIYKKLTVYDYSVDYQWRIKLIEVLSSIYFVTTWRILFYFFINIWKFPFIHWLCGIPFCSNIPNRLWMHCLCSFWLFVNYNYRNPSPSVIWGRALFLMQIT